MKGVFLPANPCQQGMARFSDAPRMFEKRGGHDPLFWSKNFPQFPSARFFRSATRSSSAVSYQKPLDRTFRVVLQPTLREPPYRFAHLFPNLVATASKQALSLCIENRLCAVQPVERTQQSLEHLVSQAKLPCDHFDVGHNV